MKGMVMTSVVLYGSIDVREHDVWGWYQYSLKLNEELGYPSTHLGIIGDNFKTGKLTSLKRTELKLKKALESQEKIENVSVYALPQDFTQAAFDYTTCSMINADVDNQFVIVSIPKDDFAKIDKSKLIRDLGEFITCREGEVFELSVYESPFIYATKVNEVSDYESLKVIERFTK